ncbi:MAG: leucyl aminopeptidase [Gemmatimonadaceae bacterium]|nr:leucyl aminopeptidase [Gemmatimonadaceae bacterium]
MIDITLSAVAPGAASSPLLVVALPAQPAVGGPLSELDATLGGALQRSLARSDFRGSRDETLHLGGVADGGPQRVLLVGMGKITDRRASIRRAAAIAARHAVKYGTGTVDFWAGALVDVEVEAAVVGLAAGAWEYKEQKSLPPEDERRTPLSRAAVLVDDIEAAQPGLASGNAIAAGHALARRLAMMPGNLCTPDYLAATAEDIGARHGLRITVLGREEMTREKMGSFLCVAQGTPQDPKLVVLEYRGGAEGAQPVALVGKGLCFDSGGISIKPAQGMELMKFDMCGAAGVLGAMEAIARLELPVNVVGLIGATTNMPSGTAVNPGDVVQASNGKYIEIINTDAEGRLVLADVLAYTKRFDPVAVIDAATLTGACVVALGHTATGVMGNDDALVNEVIAAGARAGEPGWALPLWDDYKELIRSDVADVKNSGGRAAGTITAALFLQEFVDGFPWVHLDIAGTAYTESDLVTLPRGPTGTPVGTFVEFVRARAV